MFMLRSCHIGGTISTSFQLVTTVHVNIQVNYDLSLEILSQHCSTVQVIMVSISKFRPSNKCTGGHFGNYCSVNKISRLTVALMPAMWVIDSCD